MYTFIDIHSHVHGEEYDTDRAELLAELAELGGFTIAVGTDYIESLRARSVAEEHVNVYYCAGIHPVDDRTLIFDKEKIRQIAEHTKCVGIGECGLDYYWPSEKDWYTLPEEEGYLFRESLEKARQEKLFQGQIELALELDLPLMIHGRPSKGTMDAYADIIRILKVYKEKHSDKLRGNIHFFVGSIDIAQEFLELGFTMSFTGVITFSHDCDEVVRFLPLDSIQAETDAPYVSPKPYRGRRNENKHVREVIKKIAELKELSLSQVEVQLLVNAKRVWGIL
jgi:TatD DNase family protein